MSNLRYPAIIFFAVVTLSLILPVFYYPHLPETIASHFNMRNEPDAWISKQTSIVIHFATMVFLAVMFSCIIYFVPKLPKTMINLPNKDYWLNEKNREETFLVFRRFMFWLGSITIGFLTFIIQEVYNTNISGKGKLTFAVWIYFAFMLITMSFLTIKMIIYFSKIDKQP
ncbi:MAG: DUF1648 domain-containing protein [Ignavibacteriales bacterium]|nr:DUF1648 domain-containing protein [Ignavibacteriales bacterium]